MRLRFDQLGKQIGLEALKSSGPTTAHDEISADARYADLRHEPDPARSAERVRLGLLGRLASVLCLIEVYGHAPGPEEFRACLSKHILFWQQRTREVRSKENKEKKEKHHPPSNQPSAPPFLWIVAAGSPTAILTGLKFRRASGWPRGVYVLSNILRVGIVVGSELARERSTILVRLMAAGRLLKQAIEDLDALPADAHEHAVASDIVLKLWHALDVKPKRTANEQEFIVSTQSMVEKLRNEGRSEGRSEGRKEGRDEGRKEGRSEGQVLHARAVIRRVLAARKLVPSRTEDARLDACADLATLDRWHDLALTAPTVADALQMEPAKAPTKAPRSTPSRPRKSTRAA